jgi:microsomal dipeptidase-like Zn-dependent dipeptidase
MVLGRWYKIKSTDMPFFDFHIHPVLKSLFSFSDAAHGYTQLSPWVPVDKSKIPFLLRWCSDFPEILQSQGNLAQLVDIDCNLIVAVLYMPEYDILDANLIKNSANGPLKVYLDGSRLNDLKTGNPFQILVQQNLFTLTNPASFGVTDRKVKLLQSRADYQPADMKTVHAVCSVEGCHTLSSKLQQYDPAEIKDNLDTLCRSVRVLSLNLTHMEQSTICNHAYGMQFLVNDGFLPKGNGISSGGIDVLTHCYQKKIMVDIKHMSLGARQQLYQLRNSPAFQAINQPVICTHAGFTGISWNEIPDYIFMQLQFKAGYTQVWQGKPVKYGGNGTRPAFNASNINLYDEDIYQILNSGGLIGFSMDERILGYQPYSNDTDGRLDYPLDIDYISNLERSTFFGHSRDVEIRGAIEGGKTQNWEDIDAGGEVDPAMSQYHLRFFMSHVMHVVVVARKFAYDEMKALGQLCIGADFDGLIDPLWICSTCTNLQKLKDAFTAQFEDFARESKVALPAAFDIAAFADGLFYENGKDFVLSRLDLLNAAFSSSMP